MNYHIKKCAEPVQDISGKSLAYVKHIIDFSGKHEDIVKSLEKEMLEASDDLDFESGGFKDKIGLIKSVTERQKSYPWAAKAKTISPFIQYDLCCIAVFTFETARYRTKEFIQKNILGEPIETVLTPL